MSRCDGKPRVFVNELKRTRRLEAKAVNIACLGRLFVAYGCMSPLTDRYLPAVSSITERRTEYLYRVEPGYVVVQCISPLLREKRPFQHRCRYQLRPLNIAHSEHRIAYMYLTYDPGKE